MAATLEKDRIVTMMIQSLLTHSGCTSVTIGMRNLFLIPLNPILNFVVRESQSIDRSWAIFSLGDIFEILSDEVWELYKVQLEFLREPARQPRKRDL